MAVVLPISIYSAITFKEYGVISVWVLGAFGFFLFTTIPILRRILNPSCVNVFSISVLANRIKWGQCIFSNCSLHSSPTKHWVFHLRFRLGLMSGYHELSISRTALDTLKVSR